MIIGVAFEKKDHPVQRSDAILVGAELKPCAGKIKGGTWNRSQLLNFLVEFHAALQVCDIDCDVV